MALAAGYLTDIIRAFRGYKKLGDASIAQVSDNDLHTLVDPDANSIAIIVKHVAGNFQSRFTDFLTTDGEKPERDRDREFAHGRASVTRADSRVVGIRMDCGPGLNEALTADGSGADHPDPRRRSRSSRRSTGRSRMPRNMPIRSPCWRSTFGAQARSGGRSAFERRPMPIRRVRSSKAWFPAAFEGVRLKARYCFVPERVVSAPRRDLINVREEAGGDDHPLRFRRPWDPVAHRRGSQPLDDRPRR